MFPFRDPLLNPCSCLSTSSPSPVRTYQQDIQKMLLCGGSVDDQSFERYPIMSFFAFFIIFLLLFTMEI